MQTNYRKQCNLINHGMFNFTKGGMHFVAHMNTLEIAGSVKQQKAIQVIYRFLNQTENHYLYEHIIILDAENTTQARETAKQIFFQYLSHFFQKADKNQIANFREFKTYYWSHVFEK